jgi:hypothetical protein
MMVIDRLVVSNLSQNATELLVSIHFPFPKKVHESQPEMTCMIFPQDVVDSNDRFSSFCNIGNLKLLFSEILLVLASQNKILQLNEILVVPFEHFF